MDVKTKQDVADAYKSMKKFIQENSKDNMQYLLIVEGQASRDLFNYNYELSYSRALALKRYWEECDIDFGNNCEVLISGSGDGRLSGTGFMRENTEYDNQRFLIHIVPKYGTIYN